MYFWFVCLFRCLCWDITQQYIVIDLLFCSLVGNKKFPKNRKNSNTDMKRRYLMHIFLIWQIGIFAVAVDFCCFFWVSHNFPSFLSIDDVDASFIFRCSLCLSRPWQKVRYHVFAEQHRQRHICLMCIRQMALVTSAIFLFVWQQIFSYYFRLFVFVRSDSFFFFVISILTSGYLESGSLIWIYLFENGETDMLNDAVENIDKSKEYQKNTGEPSNAWQAYSTCNPHHKKELSIYT